MTRPRRSKLTLALTAFVEAAQATKPQLPVTVRTALFAYLEAKAEAAAENRVSALAGMRDLRKRAKKSAKYEATYRANAEKRRAKEAAELAEMMRGDHGFSDLWTHAEVEAHRRTLAKTAHSDRGGSDKLMAEINRQADAQRKAIDEEAKQRAS